MSVSLMKPSFSSSFSGLSAAACARPDAKAKARRGASGQERTAIETRKRCRFLRLPCEYDGDEASAREV